MPQVCLLCRARVEALQAKFNQESRSAKLELVLFQDALLHLLRISRCPPFQNFWPDEAATQTSVAWHVWC